MLSFLPGATSGSPVAFQWIDIASVASVCGTFFQASRTFFAFVLVAESQTLIV
jgi:hypothetical protein